MSTTELPIGRSYRGEDPLQRKGSRRARLVEAAIEVYGTIGYRNATVDRICAAAGLTKRYFYESFTDREALLVAAYERVADILRARIEAGAGTSSDPTRGALTALFRAIDDDPRLAKIAFFEILGVSPAVDDAYRAQTGRMAGALLDIAHVRTSLPAAERTMITTGLIGAVVFIAQHWMLTGRTESVARVARSARTIVASVLDSIGR
ncbi:MAG: TetR/AcrR family transcriptional regulator [Sciscionella sp.]|nr:TetR/AcrR family transcriptional regulator [Sciscionella sp.]